MLGSPPAAPRPAIHRLEELSTPGLDALPRDRTLVILTVSPLEQHGPHLPVGVDAFTAQYFSRAIAERLVAQRPGWHVVLVPPLHLGSFTFNHVGTVHVRQRVVRDAVIDYGVSLAEAGFRFIAISNGHAGPGHLVALDEAAAAVSRRYGIWMVSLASHLAWTLLRGGYMQDVETAVGRALTAEERAALSDDAHAGWWETSMMLWLRPDLVDDMYRDLPPARYPLIGRVRPNYPLRNGGQGYVGHPALGDPEFARATASVWLDRAMALLDGVLDGTRPRAARRSPFFHLPFLRTNFWPAVAAGALALAAVTTLVRARR